VVRLAVPYGDCKPAGGIKASAEEAPWYPSKDLYGRFPVRRGLPWRGGGMDCSGSPPYAEGASIA
jgi:hypothetical protein